MRPLQIGITMFKKIEAPKVEISDADKEILKAQAKQVGKKLLITAAVTAGSAIAIRMLCNRFETKTDENVETSEN